MSDGMGIDKQFRTVKEMNRVIDKIGKAVDGEDAMLVIMACLATVLVINKDDITPDQLDAGILGASEWVSLYVTTLDAELTPNKVN